MINEPIPFQNADVHTVFNSYPLPTRQKLLFLRTLIFQTASEIPAVGDIEETLRWGEPSYLTTQTKSGSIIRIHHTPNKPFDYAMYFHCGTTLVDTFRELYPNIFRYHKNRRIEFMNTSNVPEKECKQCISLALTYNLNKV